MLKDYTAVSNWMNENFLTINYQALISEALDLIMQVELSELPVIKDNKVIGVFNFKYYLHALSNEEIAINDRVTNWMTQTFSFTSEDRKSTRLNSSHVAISYAVFCLKKKTD